VGFGFKDSVLSVSISGDPTDFFSPVVWMVEIEGDLGGFCFDRAFESSLVYSAAKNACFLKAYTERSRTSEIHWGRSVVRLV